MNKLGTKLGAIAMSAVMALTFAPSAAITSLAAGSDGVAKTAADPGQAIYGLYNPNSGEHLFTANATEATGLKAAGWQEGDVKWYSPTSGTKVYRLYNANVKAPDGTPLGDHHYTTDVEEVAKLKKAGWSEDAEFFYAQTTPGEGSVPVYKLYNPNAYTQPKYSGAHHFTLDKTEKDNLLKAGWTEGDVAFYTLGKDKPVVQELSVSINNTTPKVDDTLTATIYDENGDEVSDLGYDYQWYLAGIPMIGETANVLEVTEGMVGQKISVTATDADGKVLESLETDAVKGEDKSAEVSIVDAYGTNADGTGIVGDRLELTYGASFGTPTAVTWYRDGAVVTTAGGNTYQNMNQDGGLFLNVTAARGTGNYKAVVVADGVPYETNELTISANEDPAIIESFTIEDDYTDGTDVTYAATDTTAVATVKMNKNFQGTFRIYKKTDSKFATTVDTLNTALAPAGGIAAAADDATATSNDGFSHLVANAATNYNVLQMTPGSGEGFIARDGKATYKFAVNAGLVRGTEYVVVFDQTSRSDDNIGSGTENKFATAVTAPYLTAPATAEITKAAKNAAVEITFKDKEGNILTYMGKQTARTGVTTTNPSVNGIRVKAGSAIYSATKSGVEIKDATNQNTAQNSALTAGAVKAGVWTSGVTVTGTDAFWFANITFEKGVYGKDEITIRTADKQVAQDAGAATISYDVKTPKDAKVSFTNLRAKSTVYLVCLNDTAAAGKSTAQPTVSNETASTAFKRVYENPTTEAVASATVEPGTATYTFEGAIDGIHMGDGSSTTLPGNSYIAVIIPDDETNYSPTYTAINNPTYTAGNWAATANGFDVTPTLVSYKLNSWFATSGHTVAHDATNVYCVEDGAVVHDNPTATANKADGYLLEFIDQFGNHMDQTNAAAEDHTWNLTPDDSEMDQDAKAQIEFASGATTSTKTAVLNKLFDTMKITVTAGSGPAALKKGQSFSAKLATGQTLTLTATADAAGVATGAYTLSIK